MRNLLLFGLGALMSAMPVITVAQVSVHDGSGNDPDDSAMLDVQATDKGVLVPNVDIVDLNTEAPVTDPADGLLVWNTNVGTGVGYHYWDDTAGEWVRLITSATTLHTGTGIANKVAFWTTPTDLSADSDLHWDSGNGRLGIGAPSPSERLHVSGGAIAVDYTSSGNLRQMLYLRNNETGNNTAASIDFGFSTAADYYHAGIRAYRTNEGGTHASRIELLARRAVTGTGSSFLTPLVTAKYANTSPYVLLDGDVGILVTGNPTARLHTTGTVRFEGLTNGFLLADVNGNLSTASGSGLFTAGNGLDWSSNTLNSVWTANGTHIHNNNSGNVGIGQNNPTYDLHVNGRIGTNAISETSDARLKTDITDLSDALAKVLAMRGVNYKWRTDEYPDMKLDSTLQFGLIAQELEKVVPELVHTDSEGWKTIEYSHIVPLLIEAMKEQQSIIESERSANRDLREMLRELDARVEAIEHPDRSDRASIEPR